MSRMTAADILCATGAEYERLYWALRAQKALRGGRYMGPWERAALERQLAEAPRVTADDVRRAKAAYADAKRAMRAAKAQLRRTL
jgi:hypothetical protein